MARIALSVLNDKVRFLQKPENSKGTRKRLYPTYPAWEEFMKGIGKVKLTMQPQEKTLDKTWNWLITCVSPSLKLMEEIGKLDNRDYIAVLMEHGRMNDTQQRIYEDYKKSVLLRQEQESGIWKHDKIDDISDVQMEYENDISYAEKTEKGEFFEKRDSNLGEE